MKRVLRLAEHRHRPSGKTASFIEHHDFRSVYQPILSPTHQKMVGYEALVRVRRGNQPVAPPSLFEQASIQGVTSELDRHLLNLQGHRSVGGMRASIYNAMPEEGVDALIAYMAEFAKERG